MTDTNPNKFSNGRKPITMKFESPHVQSSTDITDPVRFFYYRDFLRQADLSWQYAEWLNENGHVDMTPASYSSKRESSANSSWCSFPDWQSAMDAAINGWKDTAKKIQEFSEEIENKLVFLCEQEGPTWDLVGSECDPGLYAAHVPECMLTWQQNESRRSEPIRICLDVSYMAYHNAPSIILRGSAIAATVDLLEKSGFRCEIDIAFATRGRSGSVATYLVQFKEANHPLDLETAAFAVCSPDAERKFIFALMEQELPATRKEHGANPAGGGYGGFADVRENIQSAYDIFWDCNDGMVGNTDKGKKELQDMIVDILARYGAINEDLADQVKA